MTPPLGFREQHHAVGRRDRRPGDTAPRLLPGVLPLDKKAEEERYVRTDGRKIQSASVIFVTSSSNLPVRSSNCLLACTVYLISVTSMSGTVSVPTMSMEMEQVLKLWRVEESDSEFSLYDFDQIADATDNFSDHQKLGQGGFGPVYKVRIYRSIQFSCLESSRAFR